MVSLLLTCSTTWLSLLSGSFLIGETPRGQLRTSALTLPYVRDGPSVRLREVLWTFRRPAMCRPGHRPFMRNAFARFDHKRTRNCLPPKQ